ncbi:G-protein beta WD-40 repeat domain containing protein [Carpediemonas membranifera]|uniref:G-protein beta WD-40 repeat domain containing protein n=1 Tax=Carpediemonas membranifera TaxID=201153 RepID=A0A8J6AST7_9EUKA|nr:G-protein beta WD-40 repeat domain containing protein [Carpediemonas membranifera]|eukprot:KAG9390600.1 G-protein beta WD-40 repeat domain containing protein [Carpediemonas membranifera]
MSSELSYGVYSPSFGHLGFPINNNGSTEHNLPGNAQRIMTSAFGAAQDAYVYQELPVQRPISMQDPSPLGYTPIPSEMSAVSSPARFTNSAISSPNIPIAKPPATRPPLHRMMIQLRQMLPDLGGRAGVMGPIAIPEHGRVYATGVEFGDGTHAVAFGEFDDHVSHLTAAAALALDWEVLDLAWLDAATLVVAAESHLVVITYDHVRRQGAVVTSRAVHTNFIRELAIHPEQTLILSGGHDHLVAVTEYDRATRTLRDVFSFDCGAVVGSVRWLITRNNVEISASLDRGDVVVIDMADLQAPQVQWVNFKTRVYTHVWLSSTIGVVGHVELGADGSLMTMFDRTTHEQTPVVVNEVPTTMVHDIQLIQRTTQGGMFIAYGSPTMIFHFALDPAGHATVVPAAVAAALPGVIQSKGMTLTTKNKDGSPVVKLVTSESEGFICAWSLAPVLKD